MKTYIVRYNVNEVDLKLNKIKVANEGELVVNAEDVWDACDKGADIAADEIEGMDNERFVYEIDDVRAIERK